MQVIKNTQCILKSSKLWHKGINIDVPNIIKSFFLSPVSCKNNLKSIKCCFPLIINTHKKSSMKNQIPSFSVPFDRWILFLFSIKNNPYEKKLKIALVEDDEVMLNKYRDYINASEFLECVIAVGAAERFMKYMKSYDDLSIILLDIGLPGISGLEAIPKIKSALPEVDVVMMTSFCDDETIFKALRLGAIGYLLKDNTQKELEKSLLSIQKGGTPLAPSIARKIVAHFNPPKSIFRLSKGKGKLTKTEKLVLNHLINGLSYQEIANQMTVSINSVRSHIKNIYSKLKIHSRVKIIEKYKNFDFSQL